MPELSAPVAAVAGSFLTAMRELASRKVIEASRGVLEDERHGTLRYWVPAH